MPLASIKNGLARAPGKVIIAGEHFVVLGALAVAMAIDRYSFARASATDSGRIEVEAEIPLNLLGKSDRNGDPIDTETLLGPLRLAAKEAMYYSGNDGAGVSLDVTCDIPVGAGLGSSASTIVAVITAVCKLHGARLVRKDIFNMAFGPESFLHSKPSGVDQAASTYGGIISFKKPDTIRPQTIKRAPLFLVCDTGIHRSTKPLVRGVVRRSMQEKKLFRGHVDEAEEISESVLRALRKSDDGELGYLMDRNHELLTRIGVSHPDLDRLVKVAKAKGALGAKMTGAGGGGCIIVLCPDQRARKRISKVLQKEGGIPYDGAVDTAGVIALRDVRALK